MNEVGPDPFASQLGTSRRTVSRRNWLNPLEALERGFALFQLTFAREAWRYYGGTALLVVCFIPMWVADAQVRISNGALFLQAAILGAAYLVRAWMVGGYMQRVREEAFGVPVSKPAGVSAQIAALGRLLAWKIILSAAVLATLPTIAGASWLHGACEFASLEAPDDATERRSLSGCLALSTQWFGGGLLLFLMLIPLWIAVWLNGLLLAMIVPQLLHSILGLNTLLSTQMGLYSLSQSSAFWLSLFAGAWLAFDPVVKCTFVVVYQHLRSRREGDDLRGLLASLPREQKKMAEMTAAMGTARSVRRGVSALLAILFCLFPAIRASAAPRLPAQVSGDAPAGLAQQTRVQKLRQALNEESQREIYHWHDAAHPSPPTWFDRLLTKIGHAIDRAWSSFWNFLRSLWPRGLTLSGGSGSGWRLKDLRLWIALVAVFAVVAGAFLFWRRRRSESAQVSIPFATVPLLDLSEAALASERSEDEWFALAGQLEDQGELRLALRAAYLGLLAGLAQREWLTIRRDRTNREYLDEFTRRWRRRPQAAVEPRVEVPVRLRGSLREFDHVWYGVHTPTSAAVSAYRQNQQELLNHVG